MGGERYATVTVFVRIEEGLRAFPGVRFRKYAARKNNDYPPRFI